MMKHWSTVTSFRNAVGGIKFQLGKMWGGEVNEITRVNSEGWEVVINCIAPEFILLFGFSIFSLVSGTSQEYQPPLEFYNIVLWGLANEIEMEATERYLQGIIRLSA